MKIYTQTFIKHKNFKDVCLKVLTSFDYGHGFALKCEWWNMGQVESFPLGVRKRLNLSKTIEGLDSKAKKSYAGDWEMLYGFPPSNLRKGDWKCLK